MRWFLKYWRWTFPAFTLMFQLLINMRSLDVLPVFADEAIYIRWSQLILSDWQRYLWFPLNDGKTPLFIWSLLPFLSTMLDPLFAARLLSVIAGAFALLIMILISRALRLGKVGEVAIATILIFAPYWFFHFRMALMDGMLAMWLSLATLAALKLSQQLAGGKIKTIGTVLRNRWFVIGSMAIWMGILTKIPFVLALPGLLAITTSAVGVKRIGRWSLINWQLFVGTVMVFLGLVLCSTLAFAPAAKQLFARGSDFLYSPLIILTGGWQQTIINGPTYLHYFYGYGGWGMLLLAVIAFILPGRRRAAGSQMLSALMMLLPIWLFGKVVYPRYLLIAMVPLTIAAACGAAAIWRLSLSKMQTRRRQLAWRILLGLLLLQITLNGLRFIVPATTAIGAIPFVSADRGQYLTTWSSGDGIKEVYQQLIQLSATHSGHHIYVVTEGRFGTLPDGLLLYNFASPLPNVSIEGLGFPLGQIPTDYKSRFQSGDTAWLIVNSNRMLWNLPQDALVSEYCRVEGPCLQVWNVADQFRQKIDMY